MRTLLSLVFFAFAKTGEGQDVHDFEGYVSQDRRQQGYLSRYDEPVPFGHITREGFGDPNSPVKPPVDNLELIFISPKNQKQAIEMLEKTPRTNFLLVNKNMISRYGRTKPKEELAPEGFINSPPETNETMLKWYDLPAIQTRNAMLPPSKRYISREKVGPGPAPVIPPRKTQTLFAGNSFQLDKDRRKIPVNWTTCEEFAVGAVFFPKDIVKLKWTPFYVWEIDEKMEISTEHTFEYPSKKLVQEYHAKYNKYLNKTVDWTKTKLFMKGLFDALLIAADNRGLFHCILEHELPEDLGDIVLPSITLRMKIEDPYLVQSYCENHLKMLMAVSGTEPTVFKEMKTEAATIKFRGPGKPIWRDFEAEKLRARLIHEAKLREEKNKFLEIDEDIPPIGQWD